MSPRGLRPSRRIFFCFETYCNVLQTKSTLSYTVEAGTVDRYRGMHTGHLNCGTAVSTRTTDRFTILHFITQVNTVIYTIEAGMVDMYRGMHTRDLNRGIVV